MSGHPTVRRSSRDVKAAIRGNHAFKDAEPRVLHDLKGGWHPVTPVGMTADMLLKARRKAEKGGYANVEFRLGEIEHLPLVDVSVDVIISNGEGVLAATGRQCGLFIDLASGRPKRVEGEMRQRFETYLSKDSAPAGAGESFA